MARKIENAVALLQGVKNVYTMNVEFYTGIDARLEAPMLLPPVPDPVDLHAARGDGCDGRSLAVRFGFGALIREHGARLLDDREQLGRGLEEVGLINHASPAPIFYAPALDPAGIGAPAGTLARRMWPGA